MGDYIQLMYGKDRKCGRKCGQKEEDRLLYRIRLRRVTSLFLLLP